ncbi:MAG: universal stress protein [Chloroflexota bacterium]
MKILISIDRSSQGKAAVILGTKIAEALSASVKLMVAGKKQDKVNKAAETAHSILKSSNVAFDSVIRFGPYVDSLQVEIEDKCFDLVVVGYRKRKPIERALTRCIASRLAHDVATSVLIVRSERSKIRKLLLGISGNGFTDELISWGTSIANTFNSKVTLVHVESAPPLMFAGLEEVEQTLEELLSTHTPTSAALQKAARAMQESGIETDLKIAYGVAHRELLRTAQEEDHDLIVMGSSWARPSFDRIILSNVTRDLLHHTKRSVLVVYPSTPQTA